jgi:hypothetical protein
MAHDVFVSYSTRDKITADAVVARLESARLRCWIAPRDILPGVEWGEAIVDGIHRARVMVLVFSSSANASPQIRREVERAVNQGIPIVPFRIEEVLPSRSLEYFLSSPHWLDALTPPVEAHIQRLADCVRTLLARLDGVATATAPRPTPSPPRAGVRKVLDSVLRRRPPVVDTGPVVGLAKPPGPPRKPGARPKPPPPAPIGLLVVFGVLLLVALAVLFFPHGPTAPKTAASRPPKAGPAAAPTSLPTAFPAVDSSTVSAAPPAAVFSDAPSANRPPKVRATYECRRGVKFSIDPDKAVVTVDGKRIGVSEDFYHRAYNFSRSGTHYAKLSLRGYSTDWVKIVVRPGAEEENADIKLQLRRSF